MHVETQTVSNISRTRALRLILDHYKYWRKVGYRVPNQWKSWLSQVLTKGGTLSLMSNIGHKAALKILLKGVLESHIGGSAGGRAVGHCEVCMTSHDIGRNRVCKRHRSVGGEHQQGQVKICMLRHGQWATLVAHGHFDSYLTITSIGERLDIECIDERWDVEFDERHWSQESHIGGSGGTPTRAWATITAAINENTYIWPFKYWRKVEHQVRCGRSSASVEATWLLQYWWRLGRWVQWATLDWSSSACNVGDQRNMHDIGRHWSQRQLERHQSVGGEYFCEGRSRGKRELMEVG